MDRGAGSRGGAEAGGPSGESRLMCTGVRAAGVGGDEPWISEGTSL